MTPEQEWCWQQWNLLNDGGVWGIPRSGLVFQKNAKAKKLVLINQMPHISGLPLTPIELKEQQEGEFRSVRENFAGIGIKVERGTNPDPNPTVSLP